MTSKIDDDRFFAWLDGELGEAEAADVATAVADDPVLAAQAVKHQALRSRLRAAFDPVMAAPVPDRIAASPIDLAAARQMRKGEAGRTAVAVPHWAAIAATLAIGIFGGTLISGLSGEGLTGPVSIDGGRLVASGELDRALTTRLASAPQIGGVRIGLTFRDGNGEICRSFSDSASSGVACRGGSEWAIRGLFGGAGPSGGAYRMAAGDDPRLAALIEDMIAGDPFDRAAEAEAKSEGWR